MVNLLFFPCSSVNVVKSVGVQALKGDSFGIMKKRVISGYYVFKKFNWIIH